MTFTKSGSLSLAMVLAALSGAATFAAGAGKNSEPRLTAITTRATSRAAELVIEASEPVPYIATRPDPFTVLLDFRNVTATGVGRIATPDPKGPIAGVAVEAAESLGSRVSRVRITLTQPLAHRVRSDRNTVVVDFDQANVPASQTRQTPRPGVQATPRLDMPAVDPIAALGLGQSQATIPAQPPPTPPEQAGSLAAQAGAVGPGSSQYSGSPVTLDFQQADLRAVLRVFSEVSGLNLIVDPAVRGTVDVSMRDVPWDQALDIVLRSNGLDKRVEGTIVRIAPRDVFTAEDKSLMDAAEASEARAAAQNLTTFTRQLSYAKGEDIKRLLADTRTITRFGRAEVDLRTNTLIIRDVPSQIEEIQNLIATLDNPQPQVEIEARIVQTNKDYARALGVTWGFSGRVDPALGNTTNLAFPNNGSLSGRSALAAAGAPSAIGLALGSINGAFNLDAALSAAENEGNAKLLSTPKVSTQNNVEAEIAQGVQIPYQVVANQTTTVNFKDAALTLRVLPQITAAGTVIMRISVDNGSRGPDVGNPPIPSINTQRANTTVLVMDGQTTVIGGIYTSQENISTDRTPGLGQVPLLKWLFRRDTTKEANSELLIFITPRIIKG